MLEAKVEMVRGFEEVRDFEEVKVLEVVRCFNVHRLRAEDFAVATEER